MAMKELLNKHEEELSAKRNEKAVLDSNIFSARTNKAFKQVSVENEIEITKKALKQLKKYKRMGVKKIVF